jgi:aminoglycoside 3-N-acetyltransferase
MNAFEALTGLAVRHLDSERLRVWRTHYHSMRTKLFPIMRTVFGTFDANALRSHLEQRIGRDFEILMVHSSLNHMKPMYEGDPLAVVRMLMDLCGPDRTLAMPAFYFGDAEAGGAFATLRRQPRIDLKRTPSQMGIATELFRRSRGVVQSRHPLYRVAAFGPLAEALTTGHERAGTPSGRGTPFDFMANHDTLILGLGTRYDVLTQVHHAEDVMGEEFPVPGKPFDSLVATVIDGGDEVRVELTGRSLLWQRDMWKLRELMAADQLEEWRYHHVPMFKTRARDVTTALLTSAKRGVTLYKRPKSAG